MDRGFKGVWIPAQIWLDETLSWPEKLYLAEIDSLDKGEGCYASAQYLAKFFGHTRQRASQIIKSLKEKRRIFSWEQEESGKISHRMKVIHAADYDKLSNIFSKNVKYICTENTKDNINSSLFDSVEKDTKKNIIELFFTLYRYKAKEATGKETNDDGSSIRPPWTGKEGSLLKLDYNTHGPAGLRRMIYHFFSDQSDTVKEFSKKAGYSYSVFHSQIPKLQLISTDPKTPCEHCGSWGRHYDGCIIIEKKKAEEAAQAQEVEESREEFSEFSIMDEVRRRQRSNNERQ